MKKHKKTEMAPSTKNKTASLDLELVDKNSHKNRKHSGSYESSYDPLKS